MVWNSSAFEMLYVEHNERFLTFRFTIMLCRYWKVRKLIRTFVSSTWSNFGNVGWEQRVATTDY